MNITTNNTVLAARDAKNNFGRMLDTAQRRPVTIQKKGRNVAVVLSYEEYEHLQKLDDAYWAARAVAAKEDGEMLDAKQTKAFLTGLLHEER